MDGATWEGAALADETGRGEASEADVSVTGGGGGALTEALVGGWRAGVRVVAETGLPFRGGTGVSAGVFLGFPQSFFPFLLPLCFSLPSFRSLHPTRSLIAPVPLCPASLLPPLPAPPPRSLGFLCLWLRSILRSMWYRSSVAIVTRSSCCSRASSVGRSLLREASVSVLSLQLVLPVTTPGPRPRPRPSPSPRPIPGASVRLQGLEEEGRHEASEPASTLSGVGDESGPSSGGKHRDLQSLVEDERDGGSSMPSKRTL